MLDQAPAAATSPHVGVQEQRRYVGTHETHEAHGRIRVVDEDEELERAVRPERLGRVRPQRLDLGFAEEVVRGSNGSEPDVDEGLVLVGSDGPDVHDAARYRVGVSIR